MYKFRNPHSCGIEQFQHGLVTKAEGRRDIRLRKQFVNFFCGKVHGQRLLKLGGFDLRGRITRQAALPHQKSEEAAHGYQMAGD